jgi:hypothetical protein
MFVWTSEEAYKKFFEGCIVSTKKTIKSTEEEIKSYKKLAKETSWFTRDSFYKNLLKIEREALKRQRKQLDEWQAKYERRYGYRYGEREAKKSGAKTNEKKGSAKQKLTVIQGGLYKPHETMGIGILSDLGRTWIKNNTERRKKDRKETIVSK